MNIENIPNLKVMPIGLYNQLENIAASFILDIMLPIMNTVLWG